MTISTPRLLVRPHVPEDFEDYFSYIMDENLQLMLGLHDVTDRASAREVFDWLRTNSEFLALCPQSSGRTVGHISIQPANIFPDRRGRDLTFAISRDFRRQGLMEEALRAVIAALFRENDYLQCEYTSFNHPSEALQKKLGFRPVKSEPYEDFTLYTCVLEPKDLL